MTTRPRQPDPNLSAPRLWLVLARAYGSISAYVERCVAASGLILSDFMVLEVLLHKGPLTISDIGQKVLLASASMTAAIDRLEQRGLVRRTFCNSDRRIRIIALTPVGTQFISAVYAQHERDLEFLTTELTCEERRVLHATLKKIGLAAHAAIPPAHELIEIPAAEPAKV
ncbi:MAG: MarR family transcriptional regulator [Acidobacteriota bacterium]|nr:MarR family transcriptional regulator [Acidobacteriota bacterium]